MRGLKLYWKRKYRLVAVVLVLAGLYVADSKEAFWANRIARDQVANFLGNKFSVTIGDVRGGIFRDMILEDVTFRSGENISDKVFTVDRMEISYRLWKVLLNKINFRGAEKEPAPEYITVFFSEKNPFVRGFISLYRYADKVDVRGIISPVLFDDQAKRGIKGSFIKQPDGKYTCDLLWDGNAKIEGVLSGEEKCLELTVKDIQDKKGDAKVRAEVNSDKEVKVYSRLDKFDFYGTEIIGDFWITYNDVEMPEFSFKAENLVINKNPFWNLDAKGSFTNDRKVFVLKEANWGNGFKLKSKVGLESPYTTNLQLAMENVQLEEVAGLFENSNINLKGVLSGELSVEGPIEKAKVKGRLFVKDGVLGPMEFNSLFATLGGKLPVVKIKDARAIKDGGQIIIGGEMDFSKKTAGEIFGKVIMETDNKVAVWEGWQIEKKDNNNVVEASRERITLRTLMEEQDINKDIKSGMSTQKEVELKYKIDDDYSIKMEVEEEKDFIGVERKVSF